MPTDSRLSLAREFGPDAVKRGEQYPAGLDREGTPLDLEAAEQSAIDAVSAIANRALHERNRHRNALLDIQQFAQSIAASEPVMSTAYAVAQIVLGKIDAALRSQR